VNVQRAAERAAAALDAGNRDAALEALTAAAAREPRLRRALLAIQRESAPRAREEAGPGGEPLAPAAVELALARATLAPASEAVVLAADADRRLIAATSAQSPGRVRTLAALLGAAVDAGEDGAAVTVAAVLRDVAALVGARDVAIEASVLRAEAALRLGADEEALGTAREAHTHAGALSGATRAAWLPRAAAAHGVAARRRGLVLEAVEAFEEATLASSGPLPGPARLASFLARIAWYGPSDDLLEGLLALASEDTEVRAEALVAWAERSVWSGRAASVSARWEEVEAAALGSGRETLRARMDALGVHMAWAAGDPEEALRRARALRAATGGEPGAWVLVAAARLEVGDDAGALQTLDELEAEERPVPDPIRRVALSLRGRAALGLGLHESARAAAARLAAQGRAQGDPAAIVAAGALAAASHLDEDQAEEAAGALEEARRALARLDARERADSLAVWGGLQVAQWPEFGAFVEEEPLERASRGMDLRLAALAHAALAHMAREAGDEARAAGHRAAARRLATAAGGAGIDGLLPPEGRA